MSCLMRIPAFGWLVGIFRRPKRVNLDAAMLTIAAAIKESDSFCIDQAMWRQRGKIKRPRFSVSLFRGDRVAVLRAGEDLDEIVEKALDEYRRQQYASGQ